MGVGGAGPGGGGEGGRAEMANVRPQASLCASFPYYRERYLLRSVITNVKLQGLFFFFFSSFFSVFFHPFSSFLSSSGDWGHVQQRKRIQRPQASAPRSPLPVKVSAPFGHY